MTTGQVLDEHTQTTERDHHSPTHRQKASRRGPATGVWHQTAFLTKALVVAIVRATVVTTVTAVGFSLLVLGVGLPILRLAERLDQALSGTVADEASSGRGAVFGALVATGRSWRQFALAVCTFCLAAIVWSVPLSLVSVPVLLAAGVEPTASIESRGWEVGIDSWGPAVACALVGAALLLVVPVALRRLVSAHPAAVADPARRAGGSDRSGR